MKERQGRKGGRREIEEEGTETAEREGGTER